MKPFKYKVWSEIHNKFFSQHDVVLEDEKTTFVRSKGLGQPVVRTAGKGFETWEKFKNKKDNFIVKLFIGEKDINKKEIYEGDVVKFHPDIRTFYHNGIYSNLGHIWIYQISDGVNVSFNHPYSETSASWSYIMNEFYSPEKYDGKSHLDVEIVGNIYENPDLFKKTF